MRLFNERKRIAFLSNQIKLLITNKNLIDKEFTQNGITFENMFVRLGSDREKETKYFKRDLDNHI